MPRTIDCEPGDVVLVRFPFTDSSSHKQRPAVVISPEAYGMVHGDAIILALTSQPQADDSLRVLEWKAAGLIKPTWIKLIAGTAATRAIAKKIGKLGTNDRARVRDALTRMIADEFRS